MNKKLEAHIQQRADKLYPMNTQGYDESDSNQGKRYGYQQGIKDADAVGFHLWTNQNPTMTPDASLEELYLTYLKTKLK